MEKFYYSSEKYLLLCIFLTALHFAINTILLYKVSVWFVTPFIVIFFHVLAWYTGLKKSYAGVNDIGIEITTIVFGKIYKYFIPWSRIIKVRYVNLLFTKELCVYGDKDLRHIYFPIRLSLINTAKFKAAVIAYSHPENLLHKAVIKYL